MLSKWNAISDWVAKKFNATFMPDYIT